MVSSVFSLICALSLVSLSHAVSLRLPLFMNQTVTDVTCPDGGQCPDHNTCCLMISGSYGCCPAEDAVCCPDKQTCCPHGTTCSGGKCVKEPIAAIALQIPNEVLETSADKIKSVPAVKKVESNDNDICPGGGDCGAGMHCCNTGVDYRCCPYGWACCGGGYYCCAVGSNDETEKEMNAALRFVQEIMAIRKKDKL